MERPLTLAALQEAIRLRDHHPDQKLRYFAKLVEEVGELARAVGADTTYADTHNIKGTVDEELYDVLYYIVALANAYGVDLEAARELKEPLNRARYGGPSAPRPRLPPAGGRIVDDPVADQVRDGQADNA